MLTRTLALALALLLSTAALPAMAEITTADRNQIILAARAGDTARTGEAIAKAASSHGGDLAEGWHIALNAAAQNTRNPKSVAHIAEAASRAAAGLGRSNATAGLELMKVALATVANVSGHAQPAAMHVAKSAAALARQALGANPDRAVETILMAINVAGPLQAADRAAGSAVALDARAVADTLRPRNTAIAGQIAMAVSKAKLKS